MNLQNFYFKRKSFWQTTKESWVRLSEEQRVAFLLNKAEGKETPRDCRSIRRDKESS